MASQRPVPTPDEESAPFWEGLRQRRVSLQQCEGCGRRRFPRMPACPFCGRPGGVDIDASGQGTVYSWVGVQRALTPGFETDVPYTVLTVDLEGGGRMFGRLSGDAGPVIGMRVAPEFVDHDSWTELRFRGVGSGGRAQT